MIISWPFDHLTSFQKLLFLVFWVLVQFPFSIVSHVVFHSLSLANFQMNGRQNMRSAILHRWTFYYRRMLEKNRGGKISFGGGRLLDGTQNTQRFKKFHRSQKDQCIFTLLGTNISLPKALLFFFFLYRRWDMLVPWRVLTFHWFLSCTCRYPKYTRSSC